jgi:peptidoglycan/LPS O-acetylase OafA/YrhL
VKLWFPEVDVLKATAILLIVFGHIDNNVSFYDLIGFLGYYNGVIGLSIFFFVSGFLLSQTDPVVSSLQDFKKFYRKKFIRIYPLYWVALASLVIIFGLLQISPGHVVPYNFSLDTMLLHFSGLQGIFPWNEIQSMWFVGVIILFYLLYPIIACVPKNLVETFVVSSGILILLIILHVSFGLIHAGALDYYPLFVSGIFINKIAYSSKKGSDENFRKKVLFSNLILLAVLFLLLALRLFHLLNAQFLPGILIHILLIGAMIPSCIIFLLFIRLFVKIRGNIMTALSLVAFGTYAIYLFHHQFLAVFALMTDLVIRDVLLQDIVILTFGFAGAVLCGILIQETEQKIFMKYKSAHER